MVSVTNNAQKERKLDIGGDTGSVCSAPSSLYDNIGNQYKAIRIKFGATEAGYAVEQALPPLLPILATLTFEDVSPQAELVSLRLGGGDNCSKFFPVLRNIPLSR